MNRLAAVVVSAAVLFLPGVPALAACHNDAPTTYTQVDLGASNASVTKNNQDWREDYVQVLFRDGTEQSYYVRAASDERFGNTDPSYEAGTSQKIWGNVIASAEVGYSPTHTELPATTLGAGLDVRMRDGFGVQGQFQERSYPTQNVGITTIGADRYYGNSHIVFAVNNAVISGVTGDAVSERLGYSTTFACTEDVSLTAAAGRDVEPTGVGTNVAVYKAFTYAASDTHWMNPHSAVQLLVEWDPLVGAYTRFNVGLALRERF